MTGKLLCLGYGYSARALAQWVCRLGWEVAGTLRDPTDRQKVARTGVTALPWSRDAIVPWLNEATHVLSSIAPTGDGDPALALLGEDLAQAASRLDWVGYLSTTGVYGDAKGGWVDEETPTAPGTIRGRRRVEAERAWGAIAGLPLHVFRLAGIYGPGRGPFEKIRNGTARRIIKPGQVFSRIHVEDIARALHASMTNPQPGAIYNLCDDDPAPPQDVLAHAADLLGLPHPPAVDFEEAELGPMARSFYSESKRVSNRRIKEALGLELAYPDYKSGLASILAAEKAAPPG